MKNLFHKGLCLVMALCCIASRAMREEERFPTPKGTT